MHYIQTLANKMQKKKNNWKEAGRGKEQSTPWKSLCVSAFLGFYYLGGRRRKYQEQYVSDWQKRLINMTEKYFMDPEFHTSQSHSLIVRKEAK